MSEFFEEKSKSRSTVYYALVATAGMFAFYLDWTAEELNMWVTYIGLILPAMGLMVAAIRTWPKRADVSRETSLDTTTTMGTPRLTPREDISAPCVVMHGTAEPHVLGCEGWTFESR